MAGVVCPSRAFPNILQLVLSAQTPKGIGHNNDDCFSFRQRNARLENLSEYEGLTVEQIVRLCIRDLIAQPDELLRITAKRILEKNAELYGRLS
jgi:hypothetical protein